MEILEDDLDVFNDKKIESEKIIDKDLLSKRTAVSQLKLPPQTVWFGTVDNAATHPDFKRHMQFALNLR